MKRPKISIICAMDEHRGIGKNNKLLWHISEDLKRFKKLTEGHVVIMGRKTFESLGKPLPNKINIIVTTNKSYKIKPYYVSINQSIKTFICHSLDEAIKTGQRYEKSNGEIFIIGGGQIYQQAIKYADKLYLTIVKGKYDADTFFPDFSMFKKKKFEEKGKSSNYEYKFVDLER
jgi:dihydrofolate reductase